jgi:hypothetical protein
LAEDSLSAAEAALRVVLSAKKKGTSPSVRTLNAVTAACEADGNWRAALQCLVWMPETRFLPRASAAILAGGGAGGAVERTKALFQGGGKGAGPHGLGRIRARMEQ